MKYLNLNDLFLISFITSLTSLQYSAGLEHLLPATASARLSDYPLCCLPGATFR